MPKEKRTRLLGLRADPDLTKAEIGDCIDHIDEIECRLFTFVNPFSFIQSDRHPEMKELLEQMDGVMADGIGVVWAGRLLGTSFRERISFDTTSLAPVIFERSIAAGVGLYLVGGEAGVADRAADVIRADFPAIDIRGVANGFFSDTDRVVCSIIESGARVVVCGMGAPRQEQFLLSLKTAGWRGLGFTCGGYLDQLQQGMHYYPRIVDRLNARFLYRLLREPKRLSGRYLLDYPKFVAKVVLAGIHERLR